MYNLDIPNSDKDVIAIYLINLVAIIIGILSGTFSIIGFAYSYKLNVANIFINVRKVNAIYGDSIKVVIGLTNESSNGIEITDLKLFQNGKQIKDNGYDYQKENDAYAKKYSMSKYFFNTSSLTAPKGSEEYEIHSNSDNFNGTLLLSKVGIPTYYSYWINKDQVPDTLKITANKRLRLFSKTKRYSIF
ncbi:hypothetical protein LNP09_01675 [Apilactobacillus kunkeei]|uniref:hypothetical protein n=1 Tax=Apilactobacillus kunkeei TaxID=148814 RepID=UPI00200B7D84|nr:hypothetical protein [Apilactobacillus kunkeei]MCK8619680.1 hypothetical protein [Apilactobacillus kunkeei]